jgi:hypothetical protein
VITSLHAVPVVGDPRRATFRHELTFAPGTLPDAAWTTSVAPATAAVADRSTLPAVPAAYVLACRIGQDLRVEEALPLEVHDGARHVGRLLQRWYGWRPAELIAPIAVAPVRPSALRRRGGSGLFFTRGVDSWSTLRARQAGPRSQHPTHLITVDNEVHVDPAIRAATLQGTRSTAEALGLPLIEVTTDVRSILDPHTDWGLSTHGSVFAGIGLLLRRTLDEAVLSPTHWTPLVRPWGSHPELEPAWSLPGLRVVHHPGDLPRWQRVAAIAHDPLVQRSLQVCWQGRSERNCGRCDKCLRVLTSLALEGELASTADRFDEPFGPEAIDRVERSLPYPWTDIIDHCDHVGLAGDALRQRWERVDHTPPPELEPMTRPIQPRLGLVGPEGAARAPQEAIETVARRLARLGLRLDHGASSQEPAPGIELVGDRSPWSVRIRVPGPASEVPVPIAELRLEHLAPLLAAISADPADIVPFDPDGAPGTRISGQR